MGDDADSGWLVGRGSADITGEPWGVGMMGYGMRFQRTRGIQLRQRSRAFVVVDRATGKHLAFVVADIGMFFANVRAAVLARLDPAAYGADNVVLTATHTHAGVAGYSGYRLYNTVADGFRPRTFDAIVDGVVASIERAHADLAPGRLRVARGELHDASVNRSPSAFDRNPAGDRQAFPERIDPTTTLLRLERQGRLVGVVNWFATHGTSLTNRNLLISGDNKGYAAYHWEHDVAGVDYLDAPGFVAAFAQTNAGDMSPNVPDATHGPTDDEIENARIIGQRQYAAAQALVTADAAELTGGLDTRLAYLPLDDLTVRPQFTGDGSSHRTSRAVLGAAFAAGTKEGRGVGFCHEGVDANPLLSTCSRLAYRLNRRVGDAQAPKAMLLPVGAWGWTADRLPVQLVRVGSLTLVALAQEVTIVAGLRLRRTVAASLGVGVEDVLVQGYANDYAGYVTTPEEYDEQRYEGGHTMFGRWQLPAYLQEVTRIADAMKAGEPVEPGPPRQRKPLRISRKVVHPSPVRCLGVLTEPPPSAGVGEVVRAAFSVSDPRARLMPTYAVIERRSGERWLRVAADGDWATTVTWDPPAGRGDWRAEVAWTVPEHASGAHRICYVAAEGSAATRPFEVG